MSEMEIGRELLSDKVYDMILGSILDGTRAPGDRIVESEIARRLGVSQAPVREAVKRLVHAGLVTSEPRRGSYVTEISPEEFAIARELRADLESVGARAAAGNVSDGDVASLRALVDRMAASVSAGDWAGFRQLDMEFHRRALAVSGHALLARVWDALEPILVSQRAIGDPSFAGNRSVMVQWHTDLIDALVAGDPTAAGEAFYAHASGALEATP
ncbi:MAG: GntR family transcriptional regulator [Rhodoglobus sp.]|jgi:DNA-binding GntR family transcriptional regulator|nr:GntR family transcriptional regulator [Rhodoglobus sp.]